MLSRRGKGKEGERKKKRTETERARSFGEKRNIIKERAGLSRLETRERPRNPEIGARYLLGARGPLILRVRARLIVLGEHLNEALDPRDR